MSSGDDLGQAFTIRQNGKFWRFVISQLKQQEAWYEFQASQALVTQEVREFDQARNMSEQCGKVAREISRQIGEQKEQ